MINRCCSAKYMLKTVGVTVFQKNPFSIARVIMNHSSRLTSIAGIIAHQAWAMGLLPDIAGCACAGNDGNVFHPPPTSKEPLVSDPGMHHGTCVTHVP